MKFTQAQTALLHAAESLGISSLTILIAAFYQYFILHGFNVQGLIGVGCISFIGAFGMLYKSLMANPNLGPATVDTVNELKSIVESHTGAISSLQQWTNMVTQPPAQSVQEVQKVAPQVPPFQFTTPVYTSLPTISMPMAAMPALGDASQSVYNLATQSVQAVPVPGQPTGQSS